MTPRLHFVEEVGEAVAEVWVGPHDFGPEDHKGVFVGQIQVRWPATRRGLQTRFWGRSVTEALDEARRLAVTP